MKKTIILSLSFLMLVFSGIFTSATATPTKPTVIPQMVVPTPPVQTIVPSNDGPKNGTLKVPLDGTFTQVSFLPDYTGGGGFFSDDGSTGAITLPFTFCFYGSNQNSYFINNNGNVSFGGGYSTYSPSGFPINNFPMLAPFWGDVDTRGGNAGSVWMKSTAHYVVVIWNGVGYYNLHNDKLNTFELIFSDGTDPLIGVGNNVAFSYTTMNWTTGDASGGVGGFGGSPATVGINKGDGVKYALVGRFDHAGNDYNGAGGLSGVGFLTDKYFAFDACQENPVITTVPISPWAVALMCAALLAVGTFFIVRMKGLKTVKA